VTDHLRRLPHYVVALGAAMFWLGIWIAIRGF